MVLNDFSINQQKSIQNTWYAKYLDKPVKLNFHSSNVKELIDLTFVKFKYVIAKQ